MKKTKELTMLRDRLKMGYEINAEPETEKCRGRKSSDLSRLQLALFAVEIRPSEVFVTVRRCLLVGSTTATFVWVVIQ
jgi:hypothetical protein